MRKDLLKTKNAYNKAAKQYHEHLRNPKTNFYHKYIEKQAMISILKSVVKNKDVLDLGCGSGVFTKKVYSMGTKSMVGLDISEGLINIAKKENPRIKFYIGNASKTPFKNSQFDLITSSLMIQYLKNLEPAFKEVSRILKKGGFFIFSISHPLVGLLSKIKIKNKKRMCIEPYFQNRRVVWEIADGAEVVDYQHTFESIIEPLVNSGFIIEKSIEPRPPKKSEKVNKEIFERTSNYPSVLIIKARKVK